MNKVTKKQQRQLEFPPLPETGFIRLRHVLYLLGNISKTMFYQGIENGDFPAPKKLTSRTSVWDVNEIRELIERVAQN